MTRACILLAAVTVLLGGIANASAQVVTSATSQPADRLTSGDWPTDIGINQRQLQLTDDQKAKIKTMFDIVAKEVKELQDPIEAKLKPVREKMTAVYEAAKAANTVKSLKDDPAYTPLLEERTKFSLELTKVAPSGMNALLPSWRKF